MLPIFSDEIAGTAQYRTLRLGNYDTGAQLDNLTPFFARYHQDLIPISRKAKNHFRNEANNDWNALISTGQSDYVRAWQGFLQRRGFLPFHQEDGVFGYVTLAGSRLFQEYVRSVEGIAEIGPPDGIVGRKTRAHAHRWDSKDLKCHWWNGAGTPSKEYLMWMDILQRSKTHYLQNPHPVLAAVTAAQNTGDSRKLADWEWKPEDVHLIGIRRNQDARATRRGNDDLFLLLLRGMVFKFYGSTDPNPGSSRSDEAYLVEGQHKYRMSWHKIGDISKVYKALKPYSGAGVLVFRDKNADDALNDADIQSGLFPPNNSINIHWSGIGRSNWSAGCQVIAGSSYLNTDNKLIDCSSFAANSYSKLGQNGKTRGAYNVLCDLVLAYSAVNEDTVWYTLGRDDVLDLHPDLGAAWASMMVENMRIE